MFCKQGIFAHCLGDEGAVGIGWVFGPIAGAQFFYATGTASNAQVLAISRGEQSPRAAQITWTGMATYGGSGCLASL